MSKLVSIRLDDDIVDMIESFDGKNFTDKFHRLCRFKSGEFSMIESRYQKYKSECSSLLDQIDKYRSIVNRLEHLSSVIEDLIIFADD